jgi:hypothetical protein
MRTRDGRILPATRPENAVEGHDARLGGGVGVLEEDRRRNASQSSTGDAATLWRAVVRMAFKMMERNNPVTFRRCKSSEAVRFARTHPSHSGRLGRVGLRRMRDNFHPPALSKRHRDRDMVVLLACSWGEWVWDTMKARRCPFVAPSLFSRLVSWFLSKSTPDGLISLAVANVCLRPFVVCFAPTSHSLRPPGLPRPATPFSCTPRYTLYC